MTGDMTAAAQSLFLDSDGLLLLLAAESSVVVQPVVAVISSRKWRHLTLLERKSY